MPSFTDDGIVTLLKLEHPENASCARTAKRPAQPKRRRVVCTRAGRWRRAWRRVAAAAGRTSPMLVTDDGIVTLLKLEHP